MLKQQNIALGIYENKLILNFFDGSGYRRNKGENHFFPKMIRCGGDLLGKKFFLSNIVATRSPL